MSQGQTTQIPALAPVDAWPTRKLPQERFDTAVKKSMDQMRGMVAGLNGDFIPAVNRLGVETAGNARDAAASEESAAHSADRAQASEESAALSQAAATRQAAAAESSADAAAQSAAAAKGSEESAAADAVRARQAADEASAIAGVDFSLTPKAGAVPLAGEDARIDVGWLPDAVASSTVMAAPAVTGNSLVAIGYANGFAASAIPGLLNTQVATFVVSVNGGDPFEVAAVNNACEFDVVVPDDTQDGIAWTVRVYALDTVGNRSAVTTVSPTTSLSHVERPSILSPANGEAIGANTAKIVLSPFACVGLQDTQEAVQYQALNVASEVIYDSGELTESADFTSHVINVPADVDVSGTYSLRARQKGATLGWSAWSADVSVGITRDYVIVVDDLLKKSFSTDGINFEPVVTEDVLFDDADATDMLETADGKIIFKTGRKNYRVSENGRDWKDVDLGAVGTSIKIVRHGNGFLAHATELNNDKYALSDDGINWREVQNFGFGLTPNYQVRDVIFMESTQRYVALVEDQTNKYLCLYATSVIGAWGQIFRKSTGRAAASPSFLRQWGDNGVLCLASQNYQSSNNCYYTVERIYSTDGGLTFTTANEPRLQYLGYLEGEPYISQKGFLLLGVRLHNSGNTTYGVFCLPSISGVSVCPTVPTLYSPLIVGPTNSDDFYVWSYFGSSYRFSASGALLQTISMPEWRFSSAPSLYAWSETLNRYIFSVGGATFLRDTFCLESPLTVNMLDGATATSSSCSFGPIGGDGYERAAGYANSGNASSIYSHAIYHTADGKNFDRYNYSGDSKNVPSPDGKLRLSCKAFGKYFFAGKDMKVYAATTPYDMGDALSNQPYALGWASAAASQSLLFTGSRLVYLSCNPNYKKIQYTTGLASPWVEGATLSYDFRSNFSADTDGNGKIVISHENGVTVSADHGNTWSAWVAWSGLVGFNPTLLRYVGGVWLAYSGIKAAISWDGLGWTAFGLPVASVAKPPAVARDGRLIIPAADGVMLVDSSTLAVEYKMFFFGGKNPAVISTY